MMTLIITVLVLAILVLLFAVAMLQETIRIKTQTIEYMRCTMISYQRQIAKQKKHLALWRSNA